MSVSGHRVPLEAFPRVLPCFQHVLPRLKTSSGRIHSQEIGFTGRLEAVRSALPGFRSRVSGRRGRDNVVPEVRVAPRSPTVAVDVGRAAVVVAGVVTAGSVAQRLGVVVVVRVHGVGEDPGETESEVGVDVGAQFGVALPRAVLGVVEDRLHGALPESEVPERGLRFVARIQSAVREIRIQILSVDAPGVQVFSGVALPRGVG